jgi:hypothetical protein
VACREAQQLQVLDLVLPVWLGARVLQRTLPPLSALQFCCVMTGIRAGDLAIRKYHEFDLKGNFHCFT